MTNPLLILLVTAIGALAFLAGSRYEGHWFVYLLFTLIANGLLFNGFRKKAIYFDTFIGIFLWLGFWLKLSLRVAFASGLFSEGVGNFDRSADAFDHALLVSSCGLAALLAASFVRQFLFCYPDGPPPASQSGLLNLYRTYRKTCVVLFVLLVLLIAASNAWLGIYQRGMVSQTQLPLGLNGVYKWLLQFGLSSIAALIIRFEIELSRNLTSIAILLPLLESFLSNVSLLSRGMILNLSALGIGGLRLFRAMKVRVAPLVLVVTSIAFAVLFAISVFTVNYLRMVALVGPEPAAMSDAAVASSVVSATALSTAPVTASKIAPVITSTAAPVTASTDARDVTIDVAAEAKQMTPPLFIDRWVGIEGVMAVSSSGKLGWDLWRQAWNEKYLEGTLSLYDQNFINSPYLNPNIDKSRNHFVSLPGIIAFLYYPGSLAFLFSSLVVCALFAAAIEFAAYRLGGQNWLLCSLFAQVVAFRYASFGYVPGQSYLFFGALALNILIIFAADAALRRYFADRWKAD